MKFTLVKNPPERLVVNEIFHSIQGESSSVGRPCVFIRLTYCNIRCSYCDTAYAFEEGSEMSFEEILRTVASFQCRLVEVTGGEPLLQENTPALLRRLCDEGYEVLLETGGSLFIGTVDPRVRRVVDIKCPSSRMSHANCWENIEELKSSDEVKFVLGTREDYEWAKDTMERYGLLRRCPVLLSPVFGVLEPARLCEWILADRLDVRFQLQAHKYIWDPQMRGV